LPPESNVAFGDGRLQTEGRVLAGSCPPGSYVPPLRKVECLTAGDDQMTEDADLRQLQGFTLWIGVRNEKHEAPIKLFPRNRMSGQSLRVAIDAYRPPFLPYVTGRCWAYRLVLRRFIILALIKDRMLTSTSSRAKIQQVAYAMPRGRFF
jgi:hypothetical protein